MGYADQFTTRALVVESRAMERFLHPADDKLREADFFRFLMTRHFHRYEFKYFLSAFLSALSSCTEHNRLFSRDPRFKAASSLLR